MNTNEHGMSIVEFAIVLIILAILIVGVIAILSGHGFSLESFLQCDPTTNIFGCKG